MNGAPDARPTETYARLTVTDTEADRAGARREVPTETLDVVETLEP